MIKEDDKNVVKKTGTVRRLLHFLDIYGIELTYNYDIKLLLEELLLKVLSPFCFWRETDGWTEEDWKLYKEDCLEELGLNKDDDE
jgi:hypothetical protein